MNSVRTIVLATLLSLLATAHAQNIGINANGAAPAASALLDIDASALPAANKRGLLIPRIALTSRTVAAPVTAPAASLVVYNTATAGTAPNNVTPGFYYWDGASQWLRMFSGNDAWSTLGNNGTTAGTNFIGTTDAKDFVVKTGGSAAANERMRVLSGGQTVVNRATAATGDVFSAYATGSSGAISGLGTSAISGYAYNGYGVYGEATQPTGVGVLANNTSTTGAAIAVQGQTASRNGTAVVGISNTANAAIPAGTHSYAVQGQVNGTLTGTGQAIGVFGITNSTMTTGNATGVWGQTESRNGTGVFGYGTSTSTATGSLPIGVWGQANNAKGRGVLGQNMNTNGTAVVGGGNGGASYTLGTGGGGAFTGTSQGSLAIATSTTGTGVIGSGNNHLTVGTLNTGSGGAFTGEATGVYSFYTAAVGDGMIIHDDYGSQWNIGGWDAFNGYYKIIGPGIVSTVVQDLEENKVLLYCPEAPEVLFQDYGTGQLENGKAVVPLDPILTKNIIVSEEHPLKVFVQLEGECNGVYVTNKSASGFDVIELQGGKSSVPFSWSITATRGDDNATSSDGAIRHTTYRQRFGPAPAYKANVHQQMENSGNDSMVHDRSSSSGEIEVQPSTLGKNTEIGEVEAK